MTHHPVKESLINFRFALILCSFVTFLHASEVGKLFYKGDIGELKDSTITIPEKGVALSEIIIVEPLLDTPIVVVPARSIFFLIDHSGGMCYDYGPSQPEYPKDQWGERFTTIQSLIDTYKRKYPYSEIGFAVFREHLYFDPDDNPRFVQCPGYNIGGYMPLLRLDSTYTPEGKKGWQILQEILEIDTVLASNDPLKPASCPNDYQYVNLKYKPSNYDSNSLSRNINVAFDAAKHAFQSSLNREDRHFIFFYSGGEANVANGPHTDVNHFVAGDSVPTTLTLFFTHDTTSSPQSLINMTDNIQINGYSTSNPISNIWAIDIDKQNLLELMYSIMDTNIITIPPPPVYIYPVDITINNYKVSNFDTVNYTFQYDSCFPLTGVTTNFEYIINYFGTRDSITPQGDTIVIELDTADSGEFDIVIQDGADLPDHYPDFFELNCWDRSLGFYYKNALVTSINKGMDTLEIRFTEKVVDVLYNYENVSVTITNSKGNKDSETFDLTKTDSCFTKFFAITVDSTPTQNDGILQVYERDTVTAIFKNLKNPKLPLDTLELSVPFYPTTAIDPNTVFSNGKFSFYLVKNGISHHSLRFNNLPNKGKIALFAINGRKIIQKQMNKGSSVIPLPRAISPGVYLLHLKCYGNIIKKKLLLQ